MLSSGASDWLFRFLNLRMKQALGYVIFVASSTPDMGRSPENNDTKHVYTVLHLVTKLFSLHRENRTFVILTQTTCNITQYYTQTCPSSISTRLSTRWQHIGDTAAYLEAKSLNS